MEMHHLKVFYPMEEVSYAIQAQVCKAMQAVHAAGFQENNNIEKLIFKIQPPSRKIMETITF